MTSVKVEQASAKAHLLDATIREILERQAKNDRRAWTGFVITALILLTVGVIGIYKQNQIAAQNKQHIDCIVKLLATPQQPGTDHKFITDAGQQCNIKFTQ